MKEDKLSEVDYLKKVIQSLLKPCPICGEEHDISFNATTLNNEESVKCLKCGLTMVKALGNSCGAVKWWNTRV